ncbi:MAG: GTPase Era [Bacteroidetes bacterium]|nr:MAG: GTPase Era [Bacteroidota bacterium]PIE88486.1 MAG: GTPase Era [Bacteroidota bacterium]
MHKAGFVNIIGKPNVGKSTLMNVLIGETLSITNAKAQTTRHRIMGIVNGEDYQIVYSDTPGMLKPAYSLQQSMMNYVEGAFTDADLFLLVVETGDRTLEEQVLERLKKTEVPLVIALNKIDLHKQERVMEEMRYWQELLPQSHLIPISAQHKFNVESISQFLLENLPESPPYYGKEELTDKPLRFFVSEIIRGELLTYYKKEIPYSCEVAITEYKEEATIDRITAIIYVVRESQKMILLGKEGQAMKRVASRARKEIEQFTGKKAFLEVTVKVLKNWRDNEQYLKRFGYEI